jgi:hypothetical protein
VRGSVQKAIGRRLKQCFRDRNSIQTDHFLIERIESTDDKYRRRYDYRFLSRMDPRDGESTDGGYHGGKAGEAGEDGQEDDFGAKPPRQNPKPPRYPRDTRDTHQHLYSNSNSSISDPLCTFTGVMGVGGEKEAISIPPTTISTADERCNHTTHCEDQLGQMQGSWAEEEVTDCGAVRWRVVCQYCGKFDGYRQPPGKPTKRTVETQTNFSIQSNQLGSTFTQ